MFTPEYSLKYQFHIYPSILLWFASPFMSYLQLNLKVKLH